MKYTFEERMFLIKSCIKYENIQKVQCTWRTKYLSKPAPSYATIRGMMASFEKTGSVIPTHQSNSRKSVKRQKAATLLETQIAENPSLSIRKAACVAEISYNLARTVLLEDLQVKPYKFQYVQKLLPMDYAKRLDFAEWYISESADVQDNMIFSDEAYFYLTLPLNKQNNRVWSKSNPNIWVEKPLQDQKLLVWCAISAKRIFGPYYFSSAINKDNYSDMLQNFFWLELRKIRDYKKYFFQQDGAAPHRADIVQEWLQAKFGEQLVSKEFWPPRSPDLTPCDSFLWGYLKSKVYNPMPKNLDDLQKNIEKEIKNISKNMLKDVFEKVKNDCRKCISAEGGHFEKIN
jgi:hypothetical protein